MRRIHLFSVWDQCYILNLFHKYDPESEDELFAIMNLLDSRLTHQNSGVVIATVRVFLKYVDLNPDLQESVYFRIKNPIVSLLIGANAELQFTIYSHILILSKQEPRLFHKEYKQFYVNSKDPEFLKIVKVQLLQTIASPITVEKILIEFEDYITDSDVSFAKEVIRSLSRIAARVPSSSKQILQILLDALEVTQLPYIVETSIIVLQEMLLLFSSQALDVLPRLAPTLELIQDPKAIASIITMIGAYGATIAESPYLIEEMIDKWDTQHEAVKYALLHSTLNIFFLRPLEVKPILSKLFQYATKDFQYPDVHDRAVFFYQLLSSNVEKCRRIVSLAQKNNPDHSAHFKHEGRNDENLQPLLMEFNTLSIIYSETSNIFIKEHSQFLTDDAHISVKAYANNNNNNNNENVAGEEEEGFEIGISLLPDPVLDPPAFQQLWTNLPVGTTLITSCSGQDGEVNLEEYFADYYIKTLAKGKHQGGHRLFLYGTEEETLECCLAEFIINFTTGEAKATIKSALSEEYIQEFSKLLEALCGAL